MLITCTILGLMYRKGYLSQQHRTMSWVRTPWRRRCRRGMSRSWCTGRRTSWRWSCSPAPTGSAAARTAPATLPRTRTPIKYRNRFSKVHSHMLTVSLYIHIYTCICILYIHMYSVYMRMHCTFASLSCRTTCISNPCILYNLIYCTVHWIV